MQSCNVEYLIIGMEEKIRHLIKKYIEGSSSLTEQIELSELLADPGNKTVEQILSHEWNEFLTMEPQQKIRLQVTTRPCPSPNQAKRKHQKSTNQVSPYFSTCSRNFNLSFAVLICGLLFYP